MLIGKAARMRCRSCLSASRRPARARRRPLDQQLRQHGCALAGSPAAASRLDRRKKRAPNMSPRCHSTWASTAPMPGTSSETQLPGLSRASQLGAEAGGRQVDHPDLEAAPARSAGAGSMRRAAAFARRPLPGRHVVRAFTSPSPVEAELRLVLRVNELLLATRAVVMDQCANAKAGSACGRSRPSRETSL